MYTEHSSHYDTIVAISNLINLNPDFVSPSCIMDGGVWR
jgi:hypothetical protein